MTNESRNYRPRAPMLMGYGYGGGEGGVLDEEPKTEMCGRVAIVRRDCWKWDFYMAIKNAADRVDIVKLIT